jgi:hypothetical protein
MVAMRIIQGWDDACQPTIKNIAEALEKLSSLGCDLETGRIWIEVPPSAPDKPSLVARFVFSAANGDVIRIDLPMLRGCRARTTLGAPIYLSLEAFHQAEVDPLGNVCLRDGSSVHAVNFNTVRFPGPWTDLEEAIIWLTIRAFKAEHIFLRRLHHTVGIDYGILHIMREPNVKELARYINEHIGQLPRAEGKPPFGFIPISKIQQTLNIVGIGKVRGRAQRDAA